MSTQFASINHSCVVTSLLPPTHDRVAVTVPTDIGPLQCGDIVERIAPGMYEKARGWHGYEPIPALPGVFKYLGFSTNPNGFRHVPSLLALMSYPGDRIHSVGGVWVGYTK